MKTENMILIAGAGVLAYFLITSKKRIEERNETIREIFKDSSTETILKDTAITLRGATEFFETPEGQVFNSMAGLNPLINPLGIPRAGLNYVKSKRQQQNIPKEIKTTPEVEKTINIMGSGLLKSSSPIYKTAQQNFRYVGNIGRVATPSGTLKLKY